MNHGRISREGDIFLSPASAQRDANGGAQFGFSAMALPSIFAVLFFAGAFFVWRGRVEGWLSPEDGAGYAMGIGSVVATVLLLIYPIRKRSRKLSWIGSVHFWFRLHMMLGIAAPVLVVAHSNFSLGSINSSVALICMMVVAGSGVIGRFIYTRIHFGLYGARATAAQLKSIIDSNAQRADTLMLASPRVRRSLLKLSNYLMQPPSNAVAAAIRVLLVGLQTRIGLIKLIFFIRLDVAKHAKTSGWTKLERKESRRELKRFVRSYLAILRKTVQFAFFERVFSLWHVLHVPLFVMMVIATIVHVAAVHSY